MKFKKLSIGLTALAILLIGAGCSHQKSAKKVTPQSVIQRVNKHAIKSYHINQVMIYHIDGQRQALHQDLLFGGQPLTVRARQSQNGQKAITWLSGKYEYIQNGSAWYKIKIKDASQAPSAVGKRMKNSNNVLASNKDMTKNAKLKKVGNNYILTVKNNKKTYDAIMRTTKSALGRLGNNSHYHEIAKHMQITHYELVETVNSKTFQLKKVNTKVKMRITGQMTIETDQTMDDIGQHSKLKIPNKIIKNAQKANASMLG